MQIKIWHHPVNLEEEKSDVAVEKNPIDLVNLLNFPCKEAAADYLFATIMRMFELSDNKDFDANAISLLSKQNMSGIFNILIFPDGRMFDSNAKAFLMFEDYEKENAPIFDISTVWWSPKTSSVKYYLDRCFLAHHGEREEDHENLTLWAYSEEDDDFKTKAKNAIMASIEHNYGHLFTLSPLIPNELINHVRFFGDDAFVSKEKILVNNFTGVCESTVSVEMRYDQISIYVR